MVNFLEKEKKTSLQKMGLKYEKSVKIKSRVNKKYLKHYSFLKILMFKFIILIIYACVIKTCI